MIGREQVGRHTLMFSKVRGLRALVTCNEDAQFDTKGCHRCHESHPTRPSLALHAVYFLRKCIQRPSLSDCDNRSPPELEVQGDRQDECCPNGTNTNTDGDAHLAC